MRLTAFFKLYKICILLHRCNLKFFAKNRFEKLRISQISENFRKFWKILLIFFEKMWFWSWAVQRSALCRSRRELSNAYLLAKFRFDTAANEPCNVVLSWVSWRVPAGEGLQLPRQAGGAGRAAPRARGRGGGSHRLFGWRKASESQSLGLWNARADRCRRLVNDRL